MTDTRIADWHYRPDSGLAANNASMWGQSQRELPPNRGRLKPRRRRIRSGSQRLVLLALGLRSATWYRGQCRANRPLPQQVDCPRHRHRPRDLYVLGRIPWLNIAVLRSLQHRSSFTVVIEELARIFPRAVRYRQ